MDQPKPPPEVWVLTVANDPEEPIRRPLGLDMSVKTVLRSGLKDQGSAKNKILCHQVTSGHDHCGGCRIMLQRIREQTEVDQDTCRRDEGGL